MNDPAYRKVQVRSATVALAGATGIFSDHPNHAYAGGEVNCIWYRQRGAEQAVHLAAAVAETTTAVVFDPAQTHAVDPRMAVVARLTLRALLHANLRLGGGAKGELAWAAAVSHPKNVLLPVWEQHRQRDTVKTATDVSSTTFQVEWKALGRSLVARGGAVAVFCARNMPVALAPRRGARPEIALAVVALHARVGEEIEISFSLAGPCARAVDLRRAR